MHRLHQSCSHTHTHTHTDYEPILSRRAHEQERTKPSNWGGWNGLCVLESFYYAKNNKYFEPLYFRGVDLLLDSGAFTFMAGTGGSVNWDKYVEEYAAFINKYDIRKFFELDIDSLVGIKEVERLRHKLEVLTGKKSIPVWHVSRGLDYFKTMCKQYPYVAVGGYVTKEKPRAAFEKAFPMLIDIAHKAGAKIHGLGYTPVDIAKKNMPFDSIDSTAWIAGNRFGAVYKFDDAAGVMRKYDKPDGCRVKNIETAFNNFNEWCRFQRYLKKI